MIGRARAYWICQLSGWSLYALVNLLLGSTGGGGGEGQIGRWAIGMLVLSGAGLLVSHGLRALYRARRWVDQGPLRVVPAVILASAVGGVATLLITIGINGALGLMRRPLGPSEAVVLAFNLGATLLIWSGFYFGHHHVDRLRSARTAALRAELTARQAQLELLRSQLNPHFVFNCLNSVRALIDENPARAREAVTGLATLLRYTLAADRITTVSLAEEMAVVADYLRLEGIRFDERLSVELDVEPAAAEARIPPMLVQTLVENAIKHGVAHLPGGGTVSVCGRREGDGLRLQIRNPGQLLSTSPGVPGVGLANARERLRLLYGDRAVLTLRAEGSATVLADVHLPSLAPMGET